MSRRKSRRKSSEQVSMYAYGIQMLTCGITEKEHERIMNLKGCIGYDAGNLSTFTIWIYYYFISPSARDSALPIIQNSEYSWGAFIMKEPVMVHFDEEKQKNE